LVALGGLRHAPEFALHREGARGADHDSPVSIIDLTLVMRISFLKMDQLFDGASGF
jgi:hypothetical protein